MVVVPVPQTTSSTRVSARVGTLLLSPGGRQSVRCLAYPFRAKIDLPLWFGPSKVNSGGQPKPIPCLRSWSDSSLANDRNGSRLCKNATA
jgi:hypothetical protein